MQLTAKHQEYWSKNLRVTAVLLAIWFVVTFVMGYYARELPGIFSEEAVLSIVKDCILFYRRHSKGGERFAEIFTDKDFEEKSLCTYRN